MTFSWDKVASVIGIIAAVGAVWTRYVTLEQRVEFSEQVVMDLVGEIKALNSSIQRLEVKFARGHCGE